MLAMDAFLHLDTPPLGLALWSSSLICRQQWREKLEAWSETRYQVFKRVPIFISHGNHDIIVPMPFSRALRNFLVDNGFVFAYKQFKGGHDIPNDVAGLFYDIILDYIKLRGKDIPEGGVVIDGQLEDILCKRGEIQVSPAAKCMCKSRC